MAGMKLAIGLTALTVLFFVLSLNGLIWNMIRGDAGFYSILRSLGDICSLAGAFFGGLVVGQRDVPVFAMVTFWILMALEFFFGAAGMLLFGTIIVIVAFSIGSLMAGRVPWKYLLTMACVLAFLNYGKFPMRAKYLDENGTGSQLTLATLPSFYMEWANESLRLMGVRGLGSREMSLTSENEVGQSLLDRIDGMTSLLFITDIMKQDSIRPLYGATYTLIPPLLIPRFFWEDKPIVHGGQVMLNLYFGRQQTVEQTEKTFIAWGWLPEGIGNFGIWYGAIIIGLVLGFICGLAEGWSFSVQMLSVEGFVLLIFFMQIANSYETAASIFVTTAFQQTCSTVVGGFVVYRLLAKPRSAGIAGVRRRNLRPKKLNPAAPRP